MVRRYKLATAARDNDSAASNLQEVAAAKVQAEAQLVEAEARETAAAAKHQELETKSSTATNNVESRDMAIATLKAEAIKIQEKADKVPDPCITRRVSQYLLNYHPCTRSSVSLTRGF